MEPGSGPHHRPSPVSLAGMKVLVIENSLTIQMDPHFKDLRASIWGTNHELTAEAVNLFIQKNYLEQFLQAVTARQYG